MNTADQEYIESKLRIIPNFPQKGIIFRDITTVLKDREGLRIILDDFVARYKDKQIDFVVGAEARGFIFGAAVAYAIGAGFVLARKPGKLPAEVLQVSYDLEYGKNSIEIHKDAFSKGSRVLVIDDLLATGGTAQAVTEIVESLGATVYELAFMIELTALNGREKLKGHDVYTQLVYKI